MDQSQKHKLITKILIGSAWIDRSLETEEMQYLQQILERYHLSHDEELITLLKQPPSVDVTERWVIEYFKHSNESERTQLLAYIGKVLIADDTVSDIEHDLLDEYHELMAKMPAVDESDSSFRFELGKVVRNIGSFVVGKINKARSKY